ncbi:MAG: DNA cytosine methyltransferase [Bacteriovoracaceae bacterium]|jgi:DNA (cytosine-5)-methyltransferase 1|nr:DNA cytosine methyltransferase [Bacteriovoracaceae bacterium]
MSKKLKFVDVFAGAGGLSCGLEMAGLECILGVDSNKYAMETFNINHRKACVYCGDITKLTNKNIMKLTKNEKIHAVVGGPPCQGFSTVGTGNPNDKRNTLFLEFVRIVKLLKPEFVVVENVTGLLAKKNEKTLLNIFQKFQVLGYNLDVQVMSSEKYGVPEKRRRTIIIGTRINKVPIFPKITHDVILAKTHRPAITVGDVLLDLKTKKGHLINHDIAAAQLSSNLDKRRLARIPEGRGIRYEKDEKAFFTTSLKLGVNWSKLKENRFRQTKYFRLDRAKPSPTIMTHRHSYYHPIETRYLTQREAAKLQSFPNDFEFIGPMSAQWKQIGNAVPPLLGKAIGKVLVKMYKNQDLNNCSETKSCNSTNTSIKQIREKAFVYQQS